MTAPSEIPYFFYSWEQRKLGEVASIVGGGTPSTSIAEYWGGSIDWYSPVEIGDKIYVSESRKKITELGLQKSSAKILPIGTVLFTSRAGIGNTAILAKEGATNQGFQSLVPRRNELDSYFVYSRTDELKRYGEITGAGSTFVEVSGKQMEKMPILLPDFEEQHKIGKFFKQIDNTITLHQRKLEKLKQLKQAYLQQLFPENGKNAPRIRFANFENEWEQCEFSELAEIRRGLTYKPSDVQDVGVRVLRSSNISEDTFLLKSDDVFVKSEAVNIEEVRNGDILITSANGSNRLVGKHAIIDGIRKKTAHGGFMLVARAENPQFTNALMSSNWYSKFVNVFVSGGNGSIGNLSKTDLESQKIFVPNKDEQDKIALFFSNLDSLITLHQEKINQLKTCKKALLQKMFI